MATKTYESVKKSLSLSYPYQSVDGVSKERQVFFSDGILVVEDEGIQKFIEGLPAFRDEIITLRSADYAKQAAIAKAKAARKAADEAEAEAQAAEVAAGLRKAPEAPKEKEKDQAGGGKK